MAGSARPKASGEKGVTDMYDLRIVVEEIKGFCDLPMHVGDYFEVHAGRIIVPPGQHICMWALQSLMPFFPVKQRESKEENDWIPYTKRICCPDPNGMVIYRIDRIGDENDGKEQVRERMLPEASLCTGCRACEAVCPVGGVRIEESDEEGQPRFSPKVCRQCGNAQCMNACPTGALHKDPNTKALLVDKEKCVGCRKCAAACPFGSISFGEDRKARVCNLCGGDPACVKACPSGALAFGRKGGTM